MRGIKTDTIDAGVLCDLLRGNLLPEAYYAPRRVRDWKELVRTRASLVHIRTQAKNKIQATLAKCGVGAPVTQLFGSRGRAWLAELSLPASFDHALHEYLAVVENLDARIAECDTRVTRTAQDMPEAQLLMSIPGIGYVSALTILAEIGDITRFPSAKKLQSFAGLVPAVSSSGGQTHHGSITRQGSKWLRWILVEAAHHQRRCTRTLGFAAYYHRIQQRHGSQTAAVATARKLSAVIWRVLTDERPYEERPAEKTRVPACEVSSS